MNNGISGNSGYLTLGREADNAKGVPVAATHVVPMTDESLTSELNSNGESLVFGSKAARLLTTPGIRSHGGDITVLAEPTSTALLFDALLPRTSITSLGGGFYQWLFNSTDWTSTGSYTVDISKGIAVSRFTGVQASEISPSWSDNRQSWKVKVSALKAFHGAVITSQSTATLTLDSTNNPKPTELLRTGDTVGIRHANGTTENNTVLSKTDTTVTLTTTPGATANGDVLYIRPTTPTLEDLAPFLWSRTEFRFGADATAALTATHTPAEDGSEYSVTHEFEDDKGAQSSGSFGPSRLVRSKTIDATAKVKEYYENDAEAAKYNALSKKALVIRSFSEGQCEVRVTLNNLACIKGGDKPMVKSDEALFYEREYQPNYDRVDGQMLSVTVINKLASA
ncbi:hypothetical protein BJF87_21470 [Gordonia sp. CNJ-863]|uniref:hypothetical protein n=1 Tax=Gordonia sp. CNJ-863 TaxID=1904963 RepID=UPI00095CC59B|nr:hypothetical protein [Gordonia sp. CNJ-863]OLT47788.1 hypothetical protein BJF87_21470 [Gordonia sp. CNJ-863]